MCILADLKAPEVIYQVEELNVAADDVVTMTFAMPSCLDMTRSWSLDMDTDTGASAAACGLYLSLCSTTQKRGNRPTPVYTSGHVHGWLHDASLGHWHTFH